MFVQVIEGHAADPEGIRRQGERWQVELRPGALGFLGATGGVTDDGTCITIVRFASEADARANSDRTAQGDWWAETEKYYDGEVTFRETDEVDVWLDGGSDDAGFVQIMKGRANRDEIREMDEALSGVAASYRPDLLGGTRAWLGPEEYLEVAYFTSEAEARENEQKPPPAELAATFERFEQLMADVTYLDLRDPWLF
jgi:hypothetical protein